MCKVSIVVTCFNQKNFITETLDSVLAQTYFNWECIVVDDGSTDGSGDVIQDYVRCDSRLTYLRKRNGGVSAARNAGFARATGQYFLPLDGDDKLYRNYLSKVMECFSERPETVLVHSKTRLFGAKNKLWRLPSYSYERLLWSNMLVNSTVFRRDAFARTSGYAEEMVHGLEDWEFYIRLLTPESIVRQVNLPLFFYRIKAKSRSTEQIASGKIEESFHLIYMRNRPLYEQFAANPLRVFAERIEDFELTYTAQYKKRMIYLHAAYLLAIALTVGISVGWH